MSSEETRLTAIYWAQIAIGAIYLLAGVLVLFLTDQPMLERLVWADILGLLPGLSIIAACGRTRWGRHLTGEYLRPARTQKN
jgi:hypothetical protein